MLHVVPAGARRSLLRFVALASLVAVSGACTAPVASSAEGTADDEAAVVGGRRVAASDPIARLAVSVLDPAEGVGQFCTGIVIAKDVVLSAAHCFEDRTRVPYVRLGSGKPIHVRTVAVHGQYSAAKRKAYDKTIALATRAADVAAPIAPLNDVAVLLLDAALPSTATPASVLPASTDLTDADLFSAGFGCTSTVCDTPTDVLKKVAMHFVTAAPSANLVVLDSGGKRGSCFGDSGGPDVVVTASGVKVFAMVSTGPDACEAGISVDTLVAPYVGWIDATSQALRSGKTSTAFKIVKY